MTDEERLEKIKNSHEERVKANQFYTLGFIHADWLIEQAERVQELEKTNKKNYWIASDFKFENLNLERQNKRYREALEVAYLRLSNDYCLKETRNDILKVLEELK